MSKIFSQMTERLFFCKVFASCSKSIFEQLVVKLGKQIADIAIRKAGIRIVEHCIKEIASKLYHIWIADFDRIGENFNFLPPSINTFLTCPVLSSTTLSVLLPERCSVCSASM